MTIGLWVTLAIWIIIFFMMAYNGWHVDTVLPSYLLILLIIGAAGYTLGLGAKLTKYWFSVIF
jgi:hypothetical protein